MISPGEDQYKPALIEMWKLCFPSDSEEFVQFYFAKIYKNDETLVCILDGKPVASLQIIPYPLKEKTEITLAGYISGAMTHPDFRQQGYMDQLLKASFQVMKERGYQATFLIPQEEWLFNFYRKYGYEIAFPVNEPTVLPKNYTSKYQSELLVLRDKEVKIFTRLSDVDLTDFYTIYHRFLTEKEQVVLKNKNQTSNILEDLFIAGGTLFYNDWGLALVLHAEDKVLVKELFFHDKEIEAEFLNAISRFYPDKEITILNNPYKPFSHNKGMIKYFCEEKDRPENIYLGMMLD